MIRAVLFDFDGTLADTDQLHFECWNSVLEQSSCALTPHEYALYCSGRSSKDIARSLKTVFPGIREDSHSLAGNKDVLYLSLSETRPLCLMDSVKETLEFFSSLSLSMAVVTGATVTTVRQNLEQLEILDYFQEIIACDSVERGKPEPDGYLLALQKLTIDPLEAIAFEDTEGGIQAAKRAGIKTFAIPHSFTAEHDFSQADAVLSRMNDIFSVLSFPCHPELPPSCFQ